MNVPCRDCTDRELGCHGKCERYQEFSALCEEVRARRLKDAEDLYAITDYRQHPWRRVGRRFRR